MRLHRRITIAPGIYRDGNQLVADVRCGSARRGTETRDIKRFPLGTDMSVMVAWQLDAKVKLLRATPRAAERGSLGADIETFIDSLPQNRYRIDSEDLLAHWATSPLGERRRDSITRVEITGQMSAWLDAGVAENSVNHRLSRLRVMYRTLDDGAPNVLDGIKRIPPPEPEVRDIPARIVNLILNSLEDRGRAERGGTRPTVSQTKIRLRVMAWVGHGPATIQRIRRKEIDLAHARVFLRPRRKGKGAKGVWVSLVAPAVEALQDFIDAGLVGKTWSGGSVWKTWKVGIANATRTAARIAAETGDTSWADELANLPTDCHPYDTRHAFASEIHRRTGDIVAVKELLQHASLTTTLRYTQGAVAPRVTAATTAANATYASIEMPPPPVTKPALTLVKGAAS